ncbi:protease pro-enzyme activation domain-containing protein [Streptomyces sp. FXJ1.172]|uniref:S53 family peptidase n=1 Tax=Streptomyces sp. FXJ1.172 TaxID=710705 RepID=UPI001EEDA95B|nr:protease pro-enzyme activation domain-containing protein [Streptomyces sp. FXJ1.172]WEO99559.1 protease pro-enzyme activation domain-containing protein [Streptomyces sp. FXJ1.172]
MTGSRCRAATAMAGCAAVVAAGALLGPPGTAQAASTTPVPDTAPPAVRAMPLAGAVPSSRQLSVQVWLKPDVAGATAFAEAVSTPGSAEFHHYLTPDAYTARFGPSAEHARAVADWLDAKGLTRVKVSTGRDYVSATGPVAKVQSAFHVRINQYRAEDAHGRPTVIQSGDRDVSVPSSLAPDVLAVTGLGGTRPATTRTAITPEPGRPTATAKPPTCSRYWAQHTQAFHPAYQGLTEAALPVCGYTAGQIRAAYGATWTDTGKGQTVALTEDETPTAMFRTLKEYAKSNHLPAPKPSRFREIRTGSSCGASAHGAAQSPAVNDEAEMDSEALYAMAPDAEQLMVIGGGCDEDQALLDAALAVLTGDGKRPSASIESNSWQIPLGEVPERTVHAIDVRAAAEGVGVYFASGDTPGLTVTDSDPYAVAVGGTSLGIGAADHRVFETGWSDDYGSLNHGKWSDLGISGGGGGTSLVYGQPAYQKGVVPASMSRVRIGKRTATDRAVPDIAADGDPDTGLLTGYTESDGNGKPGPYRTVVNAGTSLACPLIAGLVADAQQGRKPFGFLDPLIYRLAGTRALHDVLPVGPRTPQQDRAAYLPADGSPDGTGIDVFDSQEHTYTEQVTAKGYDTMTGVGTPNGAAFIAGLRRAAH